MRTAMRLVALGLAGVLTLAGCSAGDAGMSDEAAADYDDSGEEAAEAPRSEGGEQSGEQPSADLGDATSDAVDEAPDSIDPLEEAGMVFVTTTRVGLQVEDPYPVLGKISAYAEAHGGGRVYRTFTAATEYEGARGIITVKLPPREMNAAVDNLSTLGEVKSLEENRDDVTVRVTNLGARIRIAEMTLDRAERWYEAATTREEEMALESLLNERTIALEDLQSQQAADSHDIALSTLTVEVYSPEAAPPPEPEPEPEVTGFWAGLKRGWDAFYGFGSDALLVLGTLLPWLVFLGLFVTLIVYIARPIRRWREKVAAARPPRPAPQGPLTLGNLLPPPGDQYTQQYPQGSAPPPQQPPPGNQGPPPVPPAGKAPPSGRATPPA